MPKVLIPRDGMTLKDEELKTVCLGIACNKNQPPEFWIPLLAPPGEVTHFAWSQNGVMRIGQKTSDMHMPKFTSARGALTDTNRNKLVEYFLNETPCDYLFQLDDDTRIFNSLGITVARLLVHEFPICAGIYYRGCEPYGPLVFVKEEKGFGYAHIMDWEPDSIIKVDAVGMGCTLIHREVFERMKKEFAIVRNWRGEFRLEHPDDLESHSAKSDQVVEFKDLPNYAEFPWYALSYMRTEDLYFCENARRLGYDIWVDTSLELDHIQNQPIHRGHFLRAREREGDDSDVWRTN